MNMPALPPKEAFYGNIDAKFDRLVPKSLNTALLKLLKKQVIYSKNSLTLECAPF